MVEFEENKDITALTTFGVPARCKLFATYSSLKELEIISRRSEFIDNEVLHIGGGSNLLFVNDFNGLILHSGIKGRTIYKKDEDTVFAIAGAAENWSDFVDWCVDEGLGGLENLALIPGEVGASAVQNIGAYGVEAADRIHAVECFDTFTRKTVRFTKDECKFGYRDSIFKHEAKGRYFVLRVSFRLDNNTHAQTLNYGSLKDLTQRLGHNPSIAEVRDEIKIIRNAKLPAPEDIGSAGSFFKNPVINSKYFEEVVKPQCPDVPVYPASEGMVKLSAGWLIDHAGLKGVSLGGAEVYTKQALVIVNKGGATAADVVALAEKVRETVKDKFGVRLYPEVNYIDTSLTVEILGSGTSKGVPEIGCHCRVCRSDDSHDKRLRASVLIKTHGLKLMIDASPDFRQQALRAGIDELDAVLITHIHYDHVGGIDDLRPFCIDGDIDIYAQPSVNNKLRSNLDYCFREHKYPGVPSFRLKDINDEPFYISGLKVIPISVNHGKLPIYGYRIGSFAYITDASYISEESMELLKGLDLLIINGLRHKPHFAHFTVEEALKIIDELKPRQAYITHICHDMGLHAEEDAKLPDNVGLAYDGLVASIS